MIALKYKVIRTDFEHLEELLNNFDREYPYYHLYQILSEHSCDGSLAVVILEQND